MKKSHIFIIVLISIFSIILGYKYYFEKKESINEDEKNFKYEYEKYNNKINESNGKKFINVSIPKDNVVKYSSYDEIREILTSGSGIIFIGNSEDPSSRSIAPILMEAVKETVYDTVYYLDVSSDQEILSVDKKENIIIQKKSTKSYNELLKTLDEYASKYYVYTEEGNEIDTNKKRVEIPTILFVKDGKVAKYHKGLLDEHYDVYEELNDKEVEILLIEFIDSINLINGSVCNENC